jgi:hypothetical protein
MTNGEISIIIRLLIKITGRQEVEIRAGFDALDEETKEKYHKAPFAKVLVACLIWGLALDIKV